MRRCEGERSVEAKIVSGIGTVTMIVLASGLICRPIEAAQHSARSGDQPGATSWFLGQSVGVDSENQPGPQHRPRGSKPSTTSGSSHLASGLLMQRDDECLFDCRRTFEAGFSAGYGIETFAGDDLRKFVNPEESGNPRILPQMEFDFSYRVGGDFETDLQFWGYGGTQFANRITEVRCDEVVAACAGFAVSGQQERAFQVGTTVETYGGFRFEFLSLQAFSDDVAKVYVKGHSGFTTVSGSGGGALDSHRVGLGLVLVTGRHEGSYIEFGFGRSDIFLDHRGSRFTFDALLTWSAPYLEDYVLTPFLRTTTISDFSDGSDSIRTVIGVRLDFDVWLFRRGEEEEDRRHLRPR